MKVCLDSSAYIAMRRGNRDVTAFLADCEAVIVPAAVVAELTEGFILDKNAFAKNIELGRFLNSKNVHFHPAGYAEAIRYAEISHSLRRKGRPIPQNDIWVAATAFETGSRVLSYDHHFDEIDGLGRLAP